jgi:hypothetical protein
MHSWKTLTALAPLTWALLCASGHAQYSAVVLPDNPIHYYRFEESDPLFESATDLGTPGGNAGTFTGGITLGHPSSNAALGNAARFDGAAGTFVDLGLFHPGNEVTVEAWVNLSAAAPVGTFHAAVARWDGSYEIDIATDERANFVVRNETNAFGLAGSNSIIDRERWHHLVGVFSGGTATVYLDGVAGTQTANIGGNLQNAGPAPDRVLIGGTRSGSVASFNFNGLIDEVAIYNYALPPARIQAHFNAGSPPPPPPPTGDIVVFETNNAADFASPAAFGSFATIPRPSNSDYADQTSGNGVTMSVPAGSPLALNANSGPVGRLNDGQSIDSRIDCCGVDGNGPNGQVDAVFFADVNQNGRFLMDFALPVDVTEVRSFVGIEACCQNRGFQNYSLYGSLADNPNTAGNLNSNPDWIKIADVAGGPAFQTAASIRSSTGSLGLYRHLLFDVRSGGDGVHDFYGEIDVFGTPIPEPGTIGLAAIALAALVAFRRRRK